MRTQNMRTPSVVAFKLLCHHIFHHILSSMMRACTKASHVFFVFTYACSSVHVTPGACACVCVYMSMPVFVCTCACIHVYIHAHTYICRTSTASGSISTWQVPVMSRTVAQVNSHMARPWQLSKTHASVCTRSTECIEMGNACGCAYTHV